MPIRNGVTKVTPFLYYYNIDIKNDNVYNIVIGDWYGGKKLKLLKSIISTWVVRYIYANNVNMAIYRIAI